MAENKLRKIEINGQRYIWTLSRINPRYMLLKVWVDGSAYKSRPLHVRFWFDDPWMNYGPLITASQTEEGRDRIRQNFQLSPITPRVVRQIIEVAREASWSPETESRQLHYEWRDQTQVPIDDATVPGEKKW